MHRDDVRWRERRADLAAAFALGWTLLLFVVAAFAPTSTRETTTADTSGRVTATTEHLSLVASQGRGVLVVLAVPVALTAMAFLVRASRYCRRVRWALGMVALVLCVLGALSVGLFYLPAAVALMVSADLSARRGRTP